jgi:DNA ligase (NAD+)
MNPRNTASGSLKMQDGEVRKRGLSSVLYQFISEDIPAESHWELLQKAQSWGFKTSQQAKLCTTLDEVKNLLISGIRKDIIYLLKLTVLF